jgi:TusA-related sulfurtransferase
VTTGDPSAKEDLPPLARMMGHTVRSIENARDGSLVIDVERGR